MICWALLWLDWIQSWELCSSGTHPTKESTCFCRNWRNLKVREGSSEELHHFARHVFSQIFQGLHGDKQHKGHQKLLPPITFSCNQGLLDDPMTDPCLLHPDFFAQLLLWMFMLYCIVQALRSVAHSLLLKEAIPRHSWKKKNKKSTLSL